MTNNSFVSPLDHLMNHKCTMCTLHETTDRVCVGGDGDIKSGVMVVGEAPGGNEELSGRVFSGRAGQVLDLALESAGLARGGVYVTNVVKCRPPDNAKPLRVSWESCRDYLEREVEAINPSHVLLLGNTALVAAGHRSGITTHRGKRLAIKNSVFNPAEIMATVHPAFVLRNPGQQSVFSEDVRRFARMVEGTFKSETVRTKYVANKAAIREVGRRLANAEVITYDVESRYHPWNKDWALVCLGLTADGITSYVIPLEHPESPLNGKWQKALRAYIGPLLSSDAGAGRKLVAQNGKFDNIQLAGAGIFVEHTFDIMLAAHILDENRPKNLGFLSQTILGADEYKGMVDLKPEKIFGEPIRNICRYNGYDIGYTHQIYLKLRQELAQEPRAARVFTKLLMPASHMIQKVEYRGMYVNQDRLWDRLEATNEKSTKLQAEVNEYIPKAWQPLNLNSPAQLSRWLFTKEKKGGLGLEPLELTATGNPSTREGVLLHYTSHPAIRALLEYRTVELKWIRTYLQPWTMKLDTASRLHTSYKLFGTVTGRLSGDMQQVPRDGFIRSVIGAPEGWSFVVADYSQVELRIAAHVSGDRRMQRAYLTGEDLHLLTACTLTGKLPQDVSSEERKKAKAVNFGFLYGMYPKKFQRYAFENYGLSITMTEAEEAREAFFRMFSDLHAWHTRQERIVRAAQQVASPIGRIRHLPDVLSSEGMVAAEAVRQAINSPVQSMASDMMLFSMCQLDKVLDPREAYMVGTLHDGIFFEIRNDAVDKWVPIIKDTMENLPLKRTFGCRLSIPIVADVEVGQHWGEPVVS